MFIEALVAAAIVAGVLAVMFDTLAGTAARHQQIEARRTALMIARSRLAAVGAEIAVTPGDVEGVQGDFNWRVNVEPGAESGVAVSRVGAPALVTVSVRAATGGPDLAVLKSLRLAPTP